LIGADRSIGFEPGLNIVAGPITTGKTSLLRLQRVLLGSGVGPFPQEIRQRVSAVGGELTIGSRSFAVIRPLVTTATAKVDIAGSDLALRLPALQHDSHSDQTYGEWLLETLGLPRLKVPSAPTQPDSAPTPVTINDYMLYCDLAQDEIDSSVFGDRDPFKNIKRKYVFQILYGLYNVEMAAIQDEIRDIEAQLRHLSVDTHAFTRFLAGTSMENRAEIDAELRTTREEIAAVETESVRSSEGQASSRAQQLRDTLSGLDARLGEIATNLSNETRTISDLERLMAQLATQAGRLTRAIVASQYLVDFEFVVCPRCGSQIGPDRGTTDECRLCLQVPSPRHDREDLIREQDRLEAQIGESRELIGTHRHVLTELEEQREVLEQDRASLGHELDLEVAAFISDSATRISADSLRRGQLMGRVRQLEEYASLFVRVDEALGTIQSLESRKDQLDASFDAEMSRRGNEAEARIAALEGRFAELLMRLDVPRFGRQPSASIDRRTLLPIVDGRKFSELSSQGLQVLVNIAHALAHHLTAIDLNLPLPGLLVIDGPTSNIGHEGSDLELIHAVYRVLVEVSADYGEHLQMIVADNDVPDLARGFIREEFSLANRLIPASQSAGSSPGAELNTLS
jgi:hypothetical protein